MSLFDLFVLQILIQSNNLMQGFNTSAKETLLGVILREHFDRHLPFEPFS